MGRDSLIQELCTITGESEDVIRNSIDIIANNWNRMPTEKAAKIALELGGHIQQTRAIALLNCLFKEMG